MRDVRAMVMRWGRGIGAVVIALALIGVVRVGHATSAPPDVAISIQSFAFIGPNGTSTTTVPVGTKVTWTQNDFGPLHSSTSDTAIWDSILMSGGQTFPFTFNQVGSFPYHCTQHLSMHGTIIVVPLVAGVSAPTGPVSGGTAVTITGAGFQSGATVTFGGVAATNVVVVNDTTITATTPAHAAGAVDIVVTDPGNLAGTLVGGFTYALPNVLPPQKQPGGAPGNPAPAPDTRPPAAPAPGNPPAPLPPPR